MDLFCWVTNFRGGGLRLVERSPLRLGTFFFCRIKMRGKREEKTCPAMIGRRINVTFRFFIK